jgi:hypothetical protein
LASIGYSVETMTSLDKKHTPIWREFEKLVARIEQTVASNDTIVRSPDRVPNLFTGRSREVDASIRTRVGSTEVLITIECRKRRASQDVTWIEQLNSKKQAIGAARTVAVSESAFSADARRMASLYGIDLRVLSEITEADIKDWAFPLPLSCVHLYKHAQPLSPPEVEYDPNGDPVDPGSGVSLSENPKAASGLDELIFTNSTGAKQSFNHIWLLAQDKFDFYSDVPTDGSVVTKKIVLNITDELMIRTTRGPRPVKRITAEVNLSWRQELIPLSQARVVKYSNVEGTSGTPIARVEFESMGASHVNILLGVQSEPNGKNARISLELIKKPTD